MATHSSILAWRIPWTVYPSGHKESDMTEQLSLSLHFTVSPNGLVVLPTFFSLSLNLVIRSQLDPSLVFDDCIEIRPV